MLISPLLWQIWFQVSNREVIIPGVKTSPNIIQAWTISTRVELTFGGRVESKSQLL